MATSYTNYTGDGSNTDYTVTFSYLAVAHVFVSVNGSDATFTWLNATTVRMDAAPASGAVVKVYRATDPVPLVDFVDAAVLFETDLDTSVLQSLFIAEEAKDAVANSSADADAAAASAVDASASAAAAAASAITAASEAAAAAASAAAAATFDPSSYHTKTTQDATDAAQDAAIVAAQGTADGAVTDAAAAQGTADAAVTAAAAAQATADAALVASSYTYGTKQTASGTTVTFSGIPANADEIIIPVALLSTSGTNDILLQLGTSGGMKTSGYASTAGNGGGDTTSATAFVVGMAVTASDALSGVLRLSRMMSGEHTWVYSVANDGGGDANYGGGTVTLSGEITQLRLLLSGADTFDGGTVNVKSI